MKQDATDLNRMHDIFIPEPVSWWPPASGWYVVLAVLVLIVLFLLYRYWRYWKLNRYRHAALLELQQAHSVTAVSELLRRTALVIAPRSEVVALTGTVWTEWLKAQAPVNMPDPICRLLSAGVYQSTEDCDITQLRVYAADWIRQHRSKT